MSICLRFCIFESHTRGRRSLLTSIKVRLHQAQLTVQSVD